MTNEIHARLTHADLAERLNMPLSTVIQLRKREGWPHCRFGKTVRFTEEQAAEIVARHIVSEAPVESAMFPSHRPQRTRRAS